MGLVRTALLLLVPWVVIFQLTDGECEKNGPPLLPEAREESTGTNPLMQRERADEENRKEEEKAKKCYKMAKELKGLFLAAREASIQGDSCSSGHKAREFLKKLDKLRTECSPGFSEKVGFSQKVVKNVTRLEVLGLQRCTNLGQESTNSPIKRGPE